MKIIKYKGGLGNQLFQYAFTRSLQENYMEKDIFADFTLYQNYSKKTKYIPDILQFDINVKIASQKILKNHLFFERVSKYPKKQQKILAGIENILNRKYYLEYTRAWRDPGTLLKYTYYNGYWQSWKYLIGIEKKLKEELGLKNKIGKKSSNAIKEYSNMNSVMVGIRRGDYLQESKHYGIFNQDYYNFCMDFISNRINNPVFVIFSNDIEWVKKHIDFGQHSIIYREKEMQDSDAEELMVMATCKHFIIVNSTYQWWGAWLSQNSDKLVIAPCKWFADNKPIDIIPPEWIQV